MRFFLFLLALLVPAIAFAQDPSTMPVDLDWSESLTLIVKSLGGLAGAKALGFVAAGVQVLMLLLRSPLGNFAGKFKLLIYLVLTLGGGVVALRMSGVDWMGSLMHASTLSAAGVLVNQILKQAKKAD